MNWFARSYTLCSHPAAWLFIVVLMCDQANVIDLFTGSIVLHVDDICFVSNLISAEDATALFGDQHERWRGSSRQRWGSPSQTPIRLLFDEDSPSIAPLRCQIVVQSSRVPPDSTLVALDDQLPSATLYILFRSLLI